MTLVEILHAMLTLTAGSGAQKWLHDEIDKLDAGHPAVQAAVADVEKVGAVFLAPPEATS